MTLSSSPDVRRLDELAAIGKAIAESGRAPFTDAAPVDLNRQLANLLKAQAGLDALAEASAMWVRQSSVADACWFEPLDAQDAQVSSQESTRPWEERHRGCLVGGVLIVGPDGPVGILYGWTAAAGPASGPMLVKPLSDAAMWLSSALEVRVSTELAAPVARPQASNEVRAMQQRLATVAHELRTPLSVFAAGVELLLDQDLGPLTDEQQHMLERMVANVDRMHNLIRNATLDRPVDEPRTESGSRPVEVDGESAPTDVAEVIRTLADRAVADGVDLVVQLPAEPLVVQMARSDLELVLDRVLDNAKKFSPDDASISIEARAERQRVAISITDQGRGMDAEELADAGKPFFRGEQPRREETPGAGLGLSLARRLTHAWNGSVQIESQVGLGTRVTFRLPSA